MSESTRFMVSLSPELAELVADNEIDLYGELRSWLQKQGLELERSPAPLVLEEKSSRAKDAVPIIAAVGLTAPAVAWAISQVINALGNNKRIVAKRRVLKPVLDGHGNIVKKNGEPVLFETEEFELLEPTPRPEKTQFTGSVGGVVRIELASEQAKG